MKKFVLLFLASSLSSMSLANDLTLPGEKWLAEFNKYVCDKSGTAVELPPVLGLMDVVFERVTTDSTLDHALLKATFTENGITCRYNAILQANNDTQTSLLVQSIAYDPEATNGSAYIDCNAGKAVLDEAFQSNDYLYYGHPHNLAFMLPVAGANEICGSDTVGVNFVVKGRIRN